jgi:hypothetical protein
MSDYDYDAQYSALLVRFEDIFKTSSDISVELLSVIKSNPTAAGAEALATSVLDHAQASPQQVDTLVVAINNLLNTLQAQSITITDEDGSDPFKDVFSSQLSGFLNDRLHETQLHEPKQTLIAASNLTLSAALFSASATKNRLLQNHKATYAFARQGLQLPDATEEQERKEVVALGACLQLSITGAMMIEQWLGKSDGQEAVVQALKGLKARGVVTTSGGLHLLDVSGSLFSTISQVHVHFHRKRSKLLRANLPRIYLLPKHGASYSLRHKGLKVVLLYCILSSPSMRLSSKQSTCILALSCFPTTKAHHNLLSLHFLSEISGRQKDIRISINGIVTQHGRKMGHGGQRYYTQSHTRHVSLYCNLKYPGLADGSAITNAVASYCLGTS